jgi:hypothetical protein
MPTKDVGANITVIDLAVLFQLDIAASSSSFTDPSGQFAQL